MSIYVIPRFSILVWFLVLNFCAVRAAYWEIAAHSAYDMFPYYKCLIVNLFFPPRFLEWEFPSDCAIS